MTKRNYTHEMQSFLTWTRTSGKVVMDCGDITGKIVKDYWSHLECLHGEQLFDGRRLRMSKTAETKLSVILSFLTFAVNEGIVQRHPAPGILRGKRVDGGRRKAVAIGDVRRILQWALVAVSEAKSDYATRIARARYLAFVLLATTGMRVNELSCLRVRDYDRSDGAVVILGKGSKPNRILLHPSAARVVEDFLVAFGAADRERQLCAIPGIKNARTTFYTVSRWLAQACADVGLPRMTSHQFRSTLATELHISGVPLADIQRLLGHSSVNTTARYVHLVDERRQAAALRIDVLAGV
jgi:site-specific recombinase XerD